MHPMKFVAVASILAAARAHVAGRALRSGTGRRGFALEAEVVAADAGVRLEDLKLCTRQAFRFLGSQQVPAAAIEKAVDFCAKFITKEDDRSYVCPHFKEALENALSGQPSDAKLTPLTFCQLTEGRMLEAQTATQVPRVGAGSLLHFRVRRSCESVVQEALEKRKDVAVAEAGDLWYSICVSQDCAHFLPSRTKWCDADHAPTHYEWVCDSSSRFVAQGAKKPEASGTDGRVNATELCSLYGGFVKDLGFQVEAYDHVMKGRGASHVPVPAQAEKALVSSQLLGDAALHALRDGSGAPVVPVHRLEHPEHAGAAAHRPLAATVLAAAAAVCTGVLALA